jgi:hypothetical protein
MSTIYLEPLEQGFLDFTNFSKSHHQSLQMSWGIPSGKLHKINESSYMSFPTVSTSIDALMRLIGTIFMTSLICG